MAAVATIFLVVTGPSTMTGTPIPSACLVSNAGIGVVECAVKNGNILVEPLAYMRGKTSNRCFVILDEAQNCSPEELEMFMTRIGENPTVVINGDLSQSDINSDSGLHDTITRVSDVRGVHVHELKYEDIVRSDIIMRYEDPNPCVHGYSSNY